MRKALSWLIMWTLFLCGHVTYRVFLMRDWTFLYPAFRFYQWSMIRSSDIQHCAALKGPWGVRNA